MSIYSCVVSHVGNSRENQEDNYLLTKDEFLAPDKRETASKTRELVTACLEQDEKHYLIAVSDGMGGHSSGEVASLLSVKYLSDNYSNIIESTVLGEKAVCNHISMINELVCNTASKNTSYRGMGATLCGVISNGYNLYGFNIGDSRLYQMYNGQLSQLSTDHTEGQRLLDLKLLTTEEVSKFPRRKHLCRYIGYSGSVSPDVFRISNTIPGSLLLLCSDGLTDVISNVEIEQILNQNAGLKQKAGLLVNEAISRNPGHGDNITVILIEF